MPSLRRMRLRYELYVVYGWTENLDVPGRQAFNYSITPQIQINWDGQPSGYAENPDNWIFL